MNRNPTMSAVDTRDILQRRIRKATRAGRLGLCLGLTLSWACASSSGDDVGSDGNGAPTSSDGAGSTTGAASGGDRGGSDAGTGRSGSGISGGASGASGGASGRSGKSGGTGVSGVGATGSTTNPDGGTSTSGKSDAGTAVSGRPDSGTSGAAVSGKTDGGTSPVASSAEDDGADCAVAALPESGAATPIAKLPDPFKKLDGTRMSSKSEWRCRRQEIKKQAEKYAYGTKPPKPESVTGTVTDKSITVKVTDKGKTASFTVTVELPTAGKGPYPAVVGLGGGVFGFPLNATLIKGEGVAVINYDPYAVGSESGSRANKQGAFYTIYGANSSAGLLVAWAWGVSRILDVLEQAGGDLLKADAVAVSGCSRFGKGALAVGVFDQRIALTIPIESGTGGVPIWRGVGGEKAQSLSSAYGETYWFGDAFGAFTSKPTSLPLDTHELVAMVAPRGLFVLDNPHIANLGPKSAHVAALAGAEVYKALGAGDNISYLSAVADGGHCSQRPEWSEPLKKHLRKYLTKTETSAGSISAASKATGSLAEWRDWDTPALD